MTYILFHNDPGQPMKCKDRYLDLALSICSFSKLEPVALVRVKKVNKPLNNQ